MPNINYLLPQAFTPSDCTGITNPAELEAMIKYALSRYKLHIERTHQTQVAWATLLLPPFLNEPADAPTLTMAERIINKRELMPHYQPFGEKCYEPGQPQDVIHEIRDTILIDARPLFTYSCADKVEQQVIHHGLHISGGAECIYQHQQVSFPVGPYGTTIPPYNQDISQAAMSLPSIPADQALMQAEIQTSHWVMFIPTTGFSLKSQLFFSHPNSGFKEVFNHYALATPHLSPGTYLPYDIIAIGDTLIPEDIPGTHITFTSTSSLSQQTPEPALTLHEEVGIVTGNPGVLSAIPVPLPMKTRTLNHGYFYYVLLVNVPYKFYDVAWVCDATNTYKVAFLATLPLSILTSSLHFSNVNTTCLWPGRGAVWSSATSVVVFVTVHRVGVPFCCCVVVIVVMVLRCGCGVPW
ncbi:uncharacterized protein LACBIDRAFT_330582 [Laccaria bicolor S238N-H82]|uniref:Predicted protein n=1 Tax=Laccaria bicolor (strain S238N-H82 / ATCC MYA-4686) TaxID=486041 RepID=B0DLS6_LACBS|nr:uncharacterized protein LACBIDRAFT_330582 [Laccaria bicolor S238N-H82]EDR04445.1 predicted protein [Laccaria bicolor S238N-H82]|eukprot:XP_001884964.1 predicted protein [Laccaria bicolor S238N-H82]